MKTSRNIGIIITDPAAVMFAHSISNSDMNALTAKGIVLTEELVSREANRNSHQEKLKHIIDAVRIPGATRGRKIVK